ncbi:MAG: GIY-YIG nuclease family protein [Hyphomonadaceae bacterium]|nr:GIY-YIG nuclease family protein [Hyphomonadaceae bacterium]
MGAYVYVLLSDHPAPATYVGWTLDVDRRLHQHNAGKGARFTRGRQWRVVHTEAFETPQEAMKREVALKRDSRLRRALRSGAAAAQSSLRAELD